MRNHNKQATIRLHRKRIGDHWIFLTDQTISPEHIGLWAEALYNELHMVKEGLLVVDTSLVDVGMYVQYHYHREVILTDVATLETYPTAQWQLQQVCFDRVRALEPLPAPPHGYISALHEGGRLVVGTLDGLEYQWGELIESERQAVMILPIDFYGDWDHTNRWVETMTSGSMGKWVSGVILPYATVCVDGSIGEEEAGDEEELWALLTEKLLFGLEKAHRHDDTEPIICYVTGAGSDNYFSLPIGRCITFRGIANTLLIMPKNGAF